MILILVDDLVEGQVEVAVVADGLDHLGLVEQLQLFVARVAIYDLDLLAIYVLCLVDDDLDDIHFATDGRIPPSRDLAQEGAGFPIPYMGRTDTCDATLECSSMAEPNKWHLGRHVWLCAPRIYPTRVSDAAIYQTRCFWRL